MARLKPIPRTDNVTARRIRIRHFFDSNVKTFSLYDNVRSIPKLTDGLKPSQRKAIRGSIHRGENAGELQLERLASMIAAVTDYHHGANSLASTIVGMADDKVPGMNNMNLFVPSGQFGSRLTPEPGAARYIFTRLSPYFRELFKKDDDCILKPLIVDGEEIEPETYIPLLPMPLINGAQGTGTGHACKIFLYHPNDIRDACLKTIDSKITPGGRGGHGGRLTPGTLKPWFRGYHGTVERNVETGQVLTRGVLEVVNASTILITELPLGVYLDKYKEFLDGLIDAGFIRDYDDASTEESFNFKISAPRSTTALDVDVLMQKFRLIGRDTENFTLWDVDGKLKRFDSAEAVVMAFVPWRLERYEERRQKLMQDLVEQIRYQSEVIRFIRFYLANTKVFKDTGRKELVELLLNKKFVDYERLLAMPIWNLTRDRIAELEKRLEDLRAQLATLEADTAVDMYKRELKAFKYVERL